MKKVRGAVLTSLDRVTNPKKANASVEDMWKSALQTHHEGKRERIGTPEQKWGKVARGRQEGKRKGELEDEEGKFGNGGGF